THQMFKDIERVAAEIGALPFVVYDFTDFETTAHHWEHWMTSQLRGARGSITDVSLQTMVIGDAHVLQPIAESFRNGYGGTPIAVYASIDEAVEHAMIASRVLAAW
ncbi:MAG: hypothetical protein AAF125_22350, partial [Chloroflexota bacterium]